MDHPHYSITLNEVNILTTFTQWIIRVQEQCLISYLDPSLNKDAVKFLTKWEPKDLINHKNKLKVLVYCYETNSLLTNSIFKKRLATALGISYNTFIAHLNHSTPIWSPHFDRLVIIKTKNSEMKTGPIQGPTLNTAPITGVDLYKLPEKLLALLPDKATVYGEFSTPRQASWELDKKIDRKSTRLNSSHWE